MDRRCITRKDLGYTVEWNPIKVNYSLNRSVWAQRHTLSVFITRAIPDNFWAPLILPDRIGVSACHSSAKENTITAPKVSTYLSACLPASHRSDMFTSPEQTSMGEVNESWQTRRKVVTVSFWLYSTGPIFRHEYPFLDEREMFCNWKSTHHCNYLLNEYRT